MMLASYISKPLGLHFETQARNEDIVLLLRRHPITQISWLLFALGLVFIPLFFVPLILELGVLPEFITFNLIIYVLFIWYLSLFGYALMSFLLWFFDVDLVTNRRLIDIKFPYLLSKEETATRITQLEDITFRRTGFIRTTFNFGDVYIQTAGARQNINFMDVPEPAGVVKKILEVWEKNEPSKARAFIAKRKDEF